MSRPLIYDGWIKVRADKPCRDKAREMAEYDGVTQSELIRRLVDEEYDKRRDAAEDGLHVAGLPHSW